MVKLNKRTANKEPTIDLDKTAKMIDDADIEESPFKVEREVNFDKVVSTGSTWLDLAISGGRRRGGGLPGGILVEVFGESGVGKTAILSEVSASAQSRGGEVRFIDGEGRLNKEYSKIYGVNIKERFDYHRSNTVSKFFEKIKTWEPKNNENVNVIAADSLASFTTDLELETGDKMGMRRAKEFSSGLRQTCVQIADNNWLVICSNQLRQSEHGKVTPGGKGIPYYATVRISAEYFKKSESVSKVTKKANINVEGKDVEVEDTIGIRVTCEIKKNSEDNPYRKADIFIIFGYGIDDIRGNLQFLKDMTKSSVYDCINSTRRSMEEAVAYIELNNLEEELRQKMMNLWYEIQEKFKVERKPKRR